jgi:hypothetical protein
MVNEEVLVGRRQEIDLTDLPQFVGLTKLARRADRSGQTISHWILEGRIKPSAYLDETSPIWTREDAIELLKLVADGRPPERYIVTAVPEPKTKKNKES